MKVKNGLQYGSVSLCLLHTEITLPFGLHRDPMNSILNVFQFNLISTQFVCCFLKNYYITFSLC